MRREDQLSAGFVNELQMRRRRLIAEQQREQMQVQEDRRENVRIEESSDENVVVIPPMPDSESEEDVRAILARRGIIRYPCRDGNLHLGCPLDQIFNVNIRVAFSTISKGNLMWIILMTRIRLSLNRWISSSQSTHFADSGVVSSTEMQFQFYTLKGFQSDIAIVAFDPQDVFMQRH